MSEMGAERLEKLDANRQRLSTQAEGAEEIYHRELLDYLGVDPLSPVSEVADDIVSFARQQELDPQRFASEISFVIREVQGFSPDITYGWFWRRIPVAEAHDQFLNSAINLIRSRYPSSREHEDFISESFQKAAELSENPQLSKTYTWLNNHRQLLNEVHNKYWKEHNIGKEEPKILDPVELTPILDSEIKSAKDRHVWIEVIYGEGSREETDSLNEYLKSIGYETTYHFEGKPDLYDVHYPVMQRVNIGSLLHSIMGGTAFRFYSECKEYVENQQKQFDDRLEEVLTDSQKGNIDLYKRFLNPVTTPLTLGTHWLDKLFVDNKLVYLEGIEVGFNMPEAVKLVDFATDQLDIYNEVNYFLGEVDFIRDRIANHQDIDPVLDGISGPVKDLLKVFLQSNTASVLERPTKLKELYEEKAYRIYRPH